MQNALSQVKDPPEILLAEASPDYPPLIARLLPAPCHLVCDVNTRRDLPYSMLCFAEPPKATRENVERIRAETGAAKALVALGSGTINDLVKYAAFLDNKPYLVIATAPSMNGYVSANASISEGGIKHSLSARGPVAVLADLPTLAAAPLDLIRAGIGDTLCRSTVQADWLLAHLLNGVPYEPMYFEWMRESENTLLSSLRAQRSNPGWIAASAAPPRNDGFIEILFTALLLSGLAMRHHGSSMPASQGEHMIAHTREMLFPELPSHFHGLEIAVTTLTMSRIQDRILSSNTPSAVIPRIPPRGILGESSLNPWIALESLLYSGNDAIKTWPAIQAAIDAIRLPTATLEAALKAAGCPLSSAELGWPEEAYAECIAKAPGTRDRFTFLRLLHKGDH